MDLQLKGQVALVTGGTKGIGRAIAETFASEGCNVAICARKEDEVKAAVAVATGSPLGIQLITVLILLGAGLAYFRFLGGKTMVRPRQGGKVTP